MMLPSNWAELIKSLNDLMDLVPVQVAAATKKGSMEHVSPEYEQRLRDLAHLLCPIKEVVQINPLSIPRDEWEEQINRWDSMGTYLEREL